METKKQAKVVKINQKQNNTPTPSMNGKLLRKRDFEKVLEHDKIYLQALQMCLEYHLIKQEKLHRKQVVLLREQTKEKINENIDLLCDYADTRIKCMDLKSQIVTQDRLYQDKMNHYNAVFIPQYNKEIEECREKFKITYKDALLLIEEKPEMSEEIVAKIEFELSWWNQLSKEDQKEEEYQLELYQPLKRLLGAYAKIAVNLEK